MLIRVKSLISLKIYYFLPDHQHLVGEFFYQLSDFVPELVETRKFLVFWNESIDGKIKLVEIAGAKLNNNKFTNSNQYLKI